MTELDKWANVHEDAFLIEEFWDWLCQKHGSFDHSEVSVKSELYEFFEIDYRQLEKERREMLRDIQRDRVGTE